MAEKKRKELTERIRSKIQEQIDRAEAERKRELFRRRIDLARSGFTAFRHKRIAEAVKAFQTYLKVLEDWKKVSEGALNPSAFDLKKDVAELLLVNAVYWDLIKLFDRTKSKEAYHTLVHYLNQYVIFSKGMSYHALSAETLRKYLSSGKARHRVEFKNAYRKLSGSRCFLATELIDLLDPMSLSVLRGFRDTHLKKRWWGKLGIWWYELLGPIVARGVQYFPHWGRKKIAYWVDLFAKKIQKRF